MSIAFGASNILVIGAGGIGCELLKNLVYSGFKKISIVDLDTIDVSNLNRQFLFRKIHIGKSKAEVACDSIKQFRKDVDLTPYHSSIFSSQFDSDFFEQFDIVFNALDNQAARRHVNRICVNISKPIIESGTAGYLGQVEPLIFAKSSSKVPRAPCFECTPREVDRRTYPTCTIRNTPSEPIHCVVWAKFLFNQLFGEVDFENEDVSPDVNDPEAKSSANENDNNNPDKNNSLWSRTTASSDCTSSPEEALILRLFRADILTLLSMRSLWKDRPDRREPCPLDADTLKAGATHPGLDGGDSADGLRDQKKMELGGWIKLFLSSCRLLRQRAGISQSGVGNQKILLWDKDDQDAMDFVASASIIRAILFHVPNAKELTRFVVKSLAGNIIPAIATTNAIIAGVMVLQAHNVLSGRIDAVRTVFLHRQPTASGRFLAPCQPIPPNPKCLVCSEGPTQELRLHCDPSEMRLVQLKEDVLIKHLGMIAPDVEIDGKGVILISSDGDETQDIEWKSLADFNLTGGSCHRLRCDDFRQNMAFYLRIVADLGGRDDTKWHVEGEYEALKEEEDVKLRSPRLLSTGAKRTHDDVDFDVEEIDSDDNSTPSRPAKILKVGLDDVIVESNEDYANDEVVILDSCQ